VFTFRLWAVQSTWVLTRRRSYLAVFMEYSLVPHGGDLCPKRAGKVMLISPVWKPSLVEQELLITKGSNLFFESQKLDNYMKITPSKRTFISP